MVHRYFPYQRMMKVKSQICGLSIRPNRFSMFVQRSRYEKKNNFTLILSSTYWFSRLTSRHLNSYSWEVITLAAWHDTSNDGHVPWAPCTFLGLNLGSNREIHSLTWRSEQVKCDFIQRQRESVVFLMALNFKEYSVSLCAGTEFIIRIWINVSSQLLGDRFLSRLNLKNRVTRYI